MPGRLEGGRRLGHPQAGMAGKQRPELGMHPILPGKGRHRLVEAQHVPHQAGQGIRLPGPGRWSSVHAIDRQLGRPVP